MKPWAGVVLRADEWDLGWKGITCEIRERVEGQVLVELEIVATGYLSLAWQYLYMGSRSFAMPQQYHEQYEVKI